MNKDNHKLVILSLLIIVLVLGGTLLHNSNEVNSNKIDEDSQYLKLLQDPSITPDGNSIIGTNFYNFNLTDLDGNPYQLDSLNSLFKMIIMFDIKDCVLCFGERIMWKKIFETYPPDRILILGICTSREKQAIKNFVDNKEMKFPILWDPERKIKTNMFFRHSPLRILLDKENKILDIEDTRTTIEHQQYVFSMVDELLIKAEESYLKEEK